MTPEERAAARVVVDASPYGVALKAALDHIAAAESAQDGMMARAAELEFALHGILEFAMPYMGGRTLHGDHPYVVADRILRDAS